MDELIINKDDLLRVLKKYEIQIDYSKYYDVWRDLEKISNGDFNTLIL